MMHWTFDPLIRRIARKVLLIVKLRSNH